MGAISPLQRDTAPSQVPRNPLRILAESSISGSATLVHTVVRERPAGQGPLEATLGRGAQERCAILSGGRPQTVQ
jgi:hypothetical protein